MLNSNSEQLNRLARSLTGSHSSADDLFQDTMVLALRFKNNFDPETNMRAWLSRIMKNRYIINMRRKNLEAKVYKAEGGFALRQWSMGEMGLRTGRADGDVYREKGFCDTVDAAIRRLKEDYRKVVILCDVNELSYAEAASTLDCPVGTIMSRLHRGRKQLKETLVSRERVEQAA
jgi:RNA polymerase sigma-70 factor (ECF subfamily)